VWYTTLSWQFWNIPHCRGSSEIYHTVVAVLKYTTLSWQFWNIPHCRGSSEIYHTVVAVGIFQNCHDSVVYFRTATTVWYISELPRQCGIFQNCHDSVLCSSEIYHTVVAVLKYTTLSWQFWNIPHCRSSSEIYHTVVAVLIYHTVVAQGVIFKNCNDSVVYFRTATTVWYISELLRQCCIF
jgi:mannitol/fructose-specific phosphotransferase system IIA component (Ntr-type)